MPKNNKIVTHLLPKNNKIVTHLCGFSIPHRNPHKPPIRCMKIASYRIYIGDAIWGLSCKEHRFSFGKNSRAKPFEDQILGVV